MQFTISAVLAPGTYWLLLRDDYYNNGFGNAVDVNEAATSQSALAGYFTSEIASTTPRPLWSTLPTGQSTAVLRVP